VIKIPNYECYEYHKESLRVYEQTKHLAVFQITEERAGLIRSALLEYRRTNNIYEVSDQVVLVNKYGSSKSLHRVLAVNAPTTIHVCPINRVTGNDLVILGFMASPYYLRHATDAEFDANHRIDSITDDCTDIRNHISPLTGVIER
jgi:hypothetical protein